MRFHVLANPTAGRFVAVPKALDRLRSECEGTASVHVPGTLQELQAAAEQIRAEGGEVVAFCGGDGTHMACATAVSRAFECAPLPAVLLASGGHANTVARNFNGRLEPPEIQVPRVFRALRGGSSLRRVRRPTLRIKDSTGQERVGFIFGAGLVAAFFQEFYARGGGGYAEASRMIARIFGGSFVGGAMAKRVLSPAPMRLLINGKKHGSEAFTLIASSVVRDLGLHMLVTHRAAEDAMRPHLIASTLGMRASGSQFWRILAGKGLRDPRGFDGLAAEFTLEGVGAYVLDGDLILAESVTVSAGPELEVVGAQG